MLLLKNTHNQRIGFTKYGKTTQGREEYRRSRETKKHLVEVKVEESKNQLLATGYINKIHGIIGGGKEATVLLAENEEEKLVCAKVFRYFTSTIKKRLQGTKHILQDDMASLAARQEYWNLVEMNEHIPVPKPQLLLDNIVIMDFIPKETGSFVAAPLLKEVDLSIFDPEEKLCEAIDILAQLFLQGQFIHGDYSEHNLMVTQNGSLVTMDVSQSVQFNTKTFIDTPVRIRIDRAVKFLETDIRNVNRYFQRVYRISIDPTEVTETIVGELPQKLRNFLVEKTMEIYPSEMLSMEILAEKERFRDELTYRRSGTYRQRPK